MKPIQFRGKETMSYNKAEQPLPPAEGAEQLLKRKYADDKWEPNFSGIIEVMTEFASQQQPTAEGAEEILLKHGFFVMTHKEGSEHVRKVFIEPVIAAMQEFATLHAQRIADKMVSERLLNFIHWLRYRNFTDDTTTDEDWLSLYHNDPDIPE